MQLIELSHLNDKNMDGRGDRVDSVVAIKFAVDVSSEGGAVVWGIAEQVLQVTDIGEHSCTRVHPSIKHKNKSHGSTSLIS